MPALGPALGMLILGFLAGAVVTKLSIKAVRFALLLLLVFVALQLIGYKAAAVHWDSLTEHAQGAAKGLHPSGGALWKFASYNLPFTIGFVGGFVRALSGLRRR